MKEVIFREDIVQIKMDTAADDSATDSIAAMLRYGDNVLTIQNGIDKYVLYILLKEFRDHAG